MPQVWSQLAGVFLASLLLRQMFSLHEKLGSTQPTGLPFVSFQFEVVLTAMLMFVILAEWSATFSSI